MSEERSNYMSESISKKFYATCMGAAVGEAIGMPAEGMSPDQVKDRLGIIDGFCPRPESEDFRPIPAGDSARQTEALISVLNASNPLPDLQEFAFLLKQALNRHPEKWPKSTTFAWPPFPDGGHYTFSFAIPAARFLAEERISIPELVDWMQSLTPASVVWQQSIWLYLRLLHNLFLQDQAGFDPDDFLLRAARYIREAEEYFPGDYKIRRRMQVTEPMMDEDLADIAISCGKVSYLAEDMITFVGVVFYRYYKDYAQALSEAARLGGASEASCFYLGSLFGALGGVQMIPEKWMTGYSGKGQLEKSILSFEMRIQERLP